MAANASLTTGRTLQTMVAVATSTLCFWADYNETHVFNPNWPPHAKFHNGQTMSFGFTTGLLANFLVWKTVLFPSILPSISNRDAAYLSAMTGSLYWVCGLSAILYPGTTWLDPEFKKDPTAPDTVGPQAYGFTVIAGLTWVGLWFTLRGLKQKGKTS